MQLTTGSSLLLTFAILDVLNASKPSKLSNIEERVLNHCTRLEPSLPPVTVPVTVILLFSLISPIILTFMTFGGAEIGEKMEKEGTYLSKVIFNTHTHTKRKKITT